MTNANKISLTILAGFALLGSLAFAITTKANPLEFLVENSATGSISASTTALGYLSPGAGTTTVAYDSYNYGNADQYATNALSLVLQFTGSTTPINGTVATTTYNVAIEYSQDNLDWYTANGGLLATTTALGWETSKGVLIASTTPTKLLLNLTAPTRYVRAIVSIPLGSTNGSVWGEFIGQKETPR